MKYLYHILRIFFPRRKWEIIKTIDIYDDCDRMPFGKKYVLRDRYTGNLKIKKTY
jgi:hypothetical protein